MCYRKDRQGVRANVRCVCVESLPTLSSFFSMYFFMSGPFGERHGPSIWLSDLHYSLCVCIGVTVLPVIPHAVQKHLSLKTLLPGQVLHVSPKYLTCSLQPSNDHACGFACFNPLTTNLMLLLPISAVHELISYFAYSCWFQLVLARFKL